jgi:hypothetical protein
MGAYQEADEQKLSKHWINGACRISLSNNWWLAASSIQAGLDSHIFSPGWFFVIQSSTST